MKEDIEGVQADIVPIKKNVGNFDGKIHNLDGRVSKLENDKPNLVYTIIPWIALFVVLGLVGLMYSDTYQFREYSYTGYIFGIGGAMVVAFLCYWYKLRNKS